MRKLKNRITGMFKLLWYPNMANQQILPDESAGI